MLRPASQLYVGIAAVDVANRRTRSAGCKRCNALVKVNHVVQGCADLNDQDRIPSSCRFDSNPIYQDRIQSNFSTRIGSNLTYLRIGGNGFGVEVFASCILETPAQNVVLIHLQLVCSVEVKTRLVHVTPCYYSGEPNSMGTGQWPRMAIKYVGNMLWCENRHMVHGIILLCPILSRSGPNLIVV